MKCKKRKELYPYENSSVFYSLYNDDKFRVVCGIANDMNYETIGVRWLINKYGEKNYNGYPYRKYMRIPDIFAIDFLKSLLKNDKEHCDEVKINKVIKILEKQNLR